jgi:preprotein translocase subunit YajC
MDPQAAGSIGSFIPLILVFVIFYFLLIRPQQKERKRHQEMVKSLAKNDEVVTSGGIHGTIVNVKETSVVLRIDDNAKMEVDKFAVSYMIKKKSGEEK